ncbi:MAG: U32 family peptidase, partial [Lachnospiraceae bacterium]|nr:U32 family peptidase [Lachnospiraceae bacterium]
MRIEMVKKENNKTEVLAPAGTYLSMKAAINAGADAVYLSGKRFGARAFAGNFSDEELLDALDYVHLHNKKLYLTVNTLLYDEELNELESYISKLYDNGLDAVIVQDMGVLSKLHKLFPELSLHASTQMCITHADSGDILKKYGVTRIVPARELSLADLKDMRERTDLEMEVFVHGALCYGYSGQCLFSYLMGNRSGNRGSCAGSCRMDYKCDLNNLKGAFSGDNKGIGEGHIFSMRENCALPVLDRMLEIGIDSLKIEGRMKKPEYVAMVTELYRKYTDLFESLGKEGYRRYIEDNRKEYERDLLYAADMYNREGFIHNYLLGNNKNIISYKRPNHGGVQVGRVIQVDNKKNVATYRAEKNIGSHDVVEFSGEDRKPKYEYTLKEGVSTGDKVSARFLKGSNIKVGDLVYRTRNEELIERIRKSYIEQDKKVSLSLFFTAKAEEKMELKISKNGLIKTYTSDFIPQRAENKPVEKERIEKLLSEMGDTSFLADNIEVDITNDLFIPVSAVKKLRRAALSDFFKELIKANVSRFKEEEDEIKRQKEIHPFKGKENTGENASENNDSSLNYNSLSEGIYVKL